MPFATVPHRRSLREIWSHSGLITALCGAFWMSGVLWGTVLLAEDTPAKKSESVASPVTAPHPATGPNERPITIVVLGDSITKGVRAGVLPDETYSAVLERLLTAAGVRVRVINAGVGGETTVGALARILPLLTEHRPDFVTVMYGTNDSYVDVGKQTSRLTETEFRRNLERLMLRIRQAGAEPILMTEPSYAAISPKNGLGEHCNDRLAVFVEITRGVARQQQAPLIDHFLGWTNAEANGRDLNDWTTDGYHPNPTGHGDLAGRMLPALQSRLETRRRFPWTDWQRTPESIRANEELVVAGAQVFTQPGAVYFVVPQPPANHQIKLPRLENIVLRAWCWPESPVAGPGIATKNSASDVKALTPDEFQPPFTPPVDRLAKFLQSPTEWTITLPAQTTFPAIVVLDVVGLPTRAEVPSTVEAGPDGSLVLDAYRAGTVNWKTNKPSDKLQFEPLTHKNTVGYWVIPDEAARWNVQIPPGTAPQVWDVHILQGCGGGQGGSKVRISVGEAHVDFTVMETGHFQNFRWRHVGQMELAANSRFVLELRCLELAKSAVMDVRQIRLVPATKPGEPQPANAPRDLSDVAPDVFLPHLTLEPPAPGRRSLMRLAEAGKVDEGSSPAATSQVYHVLTLPTDWSAGRKFPVLVNWCGNGPYINGQGDRSSGRVEDGVLAAGLAGNDGYIVLNLPYLDGTGTRMVTQWWGTAPTHDPTATLAYAKATIARVCADFGGDPQRVMWVGFSRGSLAANALGLHDDEIASLWRGFVCFSHYDGVRTWPYPGSDAAAAKMRLARLGDRPQFFCCEMGPVAGDQLAKTRKYLQEAAPQAHIEFAETSFLNHDDRWALRPSPTRERVRQWLAEVLK